MPGITMCVGTGCPLRETCYRYMAEPNECQSFADFTGKVVMTEAQGRVVHECPEFMRLLCLRSNDRQMTSN